MPDYLFVVGKPDGPYFSAFSGAIRVDADGKTEAGTLSGVGISLLVNADQAVQAGGPEQPIILTLCLPPGPGAIAAGDGLEENRLQGQLSVRFRDAHDGLPALCIAGPATRLSGAVSAVRTLMNGAFSVGPCRFQASFGPQPWAVSFEPPESGGPVASLKLTPLGDVLFEVSSLRIDASGIAACDAQLRRSGNQCQLSPLTRVRVLEGSLVARGEALQAKLRARFGLPYFIGAEGEIDILASRQAGAGTWQFGAEAHVDLAAVWQDASGWLSFDHMGVSVGIASDGKADVRIRGRVTFNAGDLDRQAAAWLGKLFAGLSAEFSDTQLTAGGQNADEAKVEFSIRPPAPLTFDALDVFHVSVPRLRISGKLLTLEDLSLGFSVGDVSMRGSLGSLTIGLGDRHLTLKLAESGLAVDVQLSAPGGFKGSATLRQIRTEVVEVLTGEGQLSTPAFPGVRAAFKTGRFRKSPEDPSWKPTLLIYFEGEYSLPVLPGVTIRRLGIGAAVNMAIPNTSRLTLAQAHARLQNGGLPAPGIPANWEPVEEPLTLVASAIITPFEGSPEDAYEYYVGDMTLLMTSDFQITGMGKVWFQSTRVHTKTPEFQASPGAQGLFLFDGKQPSLRVAAQTRRDGKSSLSRDGVAGQLLATRIPETRFSLDASPSGFLMVLGPTVLRESLGPLRIAGSTLFAVRIASGRGSMLVRLSAGASFEQSAGASVGPASLSATVSLGFAADVMLLGQIKPGAGELVVYGHATAAAWASVALHVSIGFRIRIGLPFGRSFTISWHEDWDFRLTVHADIDLELAVSTGQGIGIRGQARVEVSVLGLSASMGLPFSEGASFIDDAKKTAADLQTDIVAQIGGQQ